MRGCNAILASETRSVSSEEDSMDPAPYNGMPPPDILWYVEMLVTGLGN